MKNINLEKSTNDIHTHTRVKTPKIQNSKI